MRLWLNLDLVMWIYPIIYVIFIWYPIIKSNILSLLSCFILCLLLFLIIEGCQQIYWLFDFCCGGTNEAGLGTTMSATTAGRRVWLYLGFISIIRIWLYVHRLLNFLLGIWIVIDSTKSAVVVRDLDLWPLFLLNHLLIVLFHTWVALPLGNVNFSFL